MHLPSLDPIQNVPKYQLQYQTAHKARRIRAAEAARIFTRKEVDKIIDAAMKKAIEKEREETKKRAIRKRNLKLFPLFDITTKVCEKYGVSYDEVQSNSRMHYVVLARWEIWVLARKNHAYSYPRIGIETGGKDHSTVLYGIRHYERLKKIMAGAVHLTRAKDRKKLTILRKVESDKRASMVQKFTNEMQDILAGGSCCWVHSMNKKLEVEEV